MLRRTAPRRFEMRGGQMHVDFRLCSRDHKRSLGAAGAVVDPSRYHSLAPLALLEPLRSPSHRLPSGFYEERAVYVPPPGASAEEMAAAERFNALPAAERRAMQQRTQWTHDLLFPPAVGGAAAAPVEDDAPGVLSPQGRRLMEAAAQGAPAGGFKPNAIRAGPLVMYIVGQPKPCAITIDFYDATWGQAALADSAAAAPFRRMGTWQSRRPRISYGLAPQQSTAAVGSAVEGEGDGGEVDIRVGMEAVEQLPLYQELRPGGLLSSVPLSALRPARPGQRKPVAGAGSHNQAGDASKYAGMLRCGMSQSPLSRRPWTRMKHYFIDELQRGPEMTEYVGQNPRAMNGVQQWRFSQHCKYFRVGIWREATRKDELIEGLHGYSSFQRSPQQSVPGVRFMAPSP